MSGMTSVLILSAGSLILSGFTFVFFLNYLKRRTSRERVLAELTADFREEAAKIEREINAVTDRDVTLVEDRVKTLRALLEDADRRIAAYVREFERRRSEEETFAALDRETSAGAVTDTRRVADAVSTGGGEGSPGATKPAENTVYLSAELFNPAAPLKNAASGGSAGAAPAASPPPQAAPHPAAPYTKNVSRSARPLPPKPLPFAERVAELYRAGFSSSLIASRLGAAITEVELAIALVERSGR
jgi:hypothetical protein